jgi:hypothetical protein
MSWQITQGSTTVTLPLAPQTVTDEAPTVDDTTITVPEQEPVLVSIGSDIRQLTFEGVLNVSGQNMAYLDTNYVTPLLGFRGLICTLSTPRSSLNSTWKLDKATFIQTKDYANNPILKFTLIFKHAASYVNL